MIVHLSSKMFSTIPQFSWIQKSSKISGHFQIPKPDGMVDVFLFHQTSFQHLRAPDFFSLGAFAACEVHTVKKRATQTAGIESYHG